MLGLDKSALVKGLQSVGKQMQSFGAGIAMIGGAMTGLGGAVLGPLIEMSRQFANAGSILNDMSGRTGVSVEALGELGYAAQMTGVDMESLEGAIRRMQKNGFNVNQMGAIADKLSAIEDPTKRAQAAMKIFGKTGTSMLPMLAGGAKGLAEMRAEAERLGLVMSTEDAESADAMGDALDTLWASVKAVRNQIGAALAPTLTQLAKTLSEGIVRVINFAKANRETILTIAKVAAAVVGVGTAITAIGMAFMAAGMAVGGFASALAMVLSPLGLILSGLAIGTAAFLTFTDTGRWMAETLMNDFGTAFGTVKDTIRGVTDALKAGEFRLAGEIAMTGLKLAFFEATKSIHAVWIQFNKKLIDTLVSAGKAMIGVIQKVANKINEAWGGFQIWARGSDDYSKAEAIAKEMHELKARRSSMTPEAFEKAYRDLVARTSGTLEAEATKNNDIFAETDARTAGIDAMAENWAAGLDEFGAAVDENLNAKLGEGEARIAALRAELAKETGTAATALAALPKTSAPGAHKAGDVGLGGVAKGGGVAATFSATALAALGQGSGPMDKLVKINEDQKKIQTQQLKEQSKMSADLAKVGALLTLA